MTHTTSTVIESQLDWLTAAVHSGASARNLEALTVGWAHDTELPTNRFAPFRLKGYEGWQAGRIRFGSREGAALVQLSGDLAALHFDELVPLADSISRLDIAVTVRLPEPDDELGLRSFTQAKRWFDNHNHAAMPSYHGDALGGYTCYVGTRTSDWYLRIYNKAAETRLDPEQSEHYRDCWRYELECKGPSTGPLVAALAASDEPKRSADIQDMVWEYVTRHGMVSAFPKAGDAQLTPGFRRRSDRASKLAWLEKSVAPAVRWLAETGDARDVWDALGFPNPTAEQLTRSIDTTTGELRNETDGSVLPRPHGN